MKKILYVSGSSDISGGQNSLWVLLSQLDRTKYQPFLICPSEGPLMAKARESGIQVGLFATAALRFALNPIKLGCDLVRMACSIRPMVQLIRKAQIALVHTTSHSLGIPWGLAGRLARVPVIWHVRDIPASFLKRRVVALLSILLASHVIAVSKAVSRVYTTDHRSSGHITVIYNAIDPRTMQVRNRRAINQLRQDLGIGQGTRVAGNIGRLIPWKGQHLCLEAASRLRGRTEVKFLIVGDIIQSARRYSRDVLDYKRKLCRLHRELGLQETVIFTGFRDDIANIMALLDVYVHTAVQPDPLPRVLLEAMASGVPIIAPYLGGVPEMIEHNVSGLLYPPSDVDTLTDQLFMLLEDEARRQRLARNALKTISRRFTTDRHVTAIMAVYDSLLG